MESPPHAVHVSFAGVLPRPVIASQPAPPMNEAHLVTLVGVLLACACLWASLHLRRRARLLGDMPTSKTLGVFIGIVELKGTAESEDPLTGYLAHVPCVIHRWSVDEHWSRTVTTTRRDAKGNVRTETRHESGWKTVAQGGGSVPFYLRDEEGVVLVRPSGAKQELMTIFDETVGRGHPLYYEKGPDGAIAHSDHRRRFSEQAIPLHAPVYVAGPARERADLVAPEIAAQADAPLFLISVRDEKSITSSLGGWSWFWWAAGLFIAGVPLLITFSNELHPWKPAVPVALGLIAGYLGLWAVMWVWMVYNSLVGLRERVRQAFSLVDVQLKRRHDLIPGLVSTVGALGTHEREVQTALASLRAQLSASSPGSPGPDFAGVAASLRVVVEKYPALAAGEGFRSLHAQLVETEQRVALARGYYNDIATQWATRLETIPECWLARLGAMRPEPLLAAADFERAAVNVRLTA
jgi:hypothetical protein